MLVLGDFNLNWLNNTSDKLKECCFNLNLTQIITEPTRPNLKPNLLCFQTKLTKL